MQTQDTHLALGRASQNVGGVGGQVHGVVLQARSQLPLQSLSFCRSAQCRQTIRCSHAETQISVEVKLPQSVLPSRTFRKEVDASARRAKSPNDTFCGETCSGFLVAAAIARNQILSGPPRRRPPVIAVASSLPSRPPSYRSAFSLLLHPANTPCTRAFHCMQDSKIHLVRGRCGRWRAWRSARC